MVKDSKAEALEAKGLYRRAASRWLEVMALCEVDKDRDWIKHHRDECVDKVRNPPVLLDSFVGLHKAATEAQHRMGITQPDAFRLPESRKRQQGK